MGPKRKSLFLVAAFLLANRVSGQAPGAPRTAISAATVLAAPTVTILSAATGVLIRSQLAGTASVDLGHISYYKGASTPGETSQKQSGALVVSTRFALRVDCPGSTPSSTVMVTMSRLDEAPSHAIAIDGTKLGSMTQILIPSMPCGSLAEHRLDLEVPVSTPAGTIGSNVVFLATLKR